MYRFFCYCCKRRREIQETTITRQTNAYLQITAAADTQKSVLLEEPNRTEKEEEKQKHLLATKISSILPTTTTTNNNFVSASSSSLGFHTTRLQYKVHFGVVFIVFILSYGQSALSNAVSECAQQIVSFVLRVVVVDDDVVFTSSFIFFLVLFLVESKV